MLRSALILLAATALSAAGVTKDRLISMIKSATPEAQIRQTVTTEGLDFEPNSAVLSEIRDAGGSLGLAVFLSGYQKKGPDGKPAPVASSYASAKSGYDTDRAIHFGFHAGIANPMGDLSAKDQMNMKMGYTAGINVMVPLQEGAALVPRFDYTQYKQNQTISGISADAKISTLMVGLDCNYFIEKQANEGFYLTAGLGYGSGKFELGLLGVSVSATAGALYADAGCGYMFTPNVGAELRYTTAKYEPEFSGVKMSATCPSLNLTVVLRY